MDTIELSKKNKIEITKATKLYAECLSEIDCDDKHKEKSILDFMTNYTKVICGNHKELKNNL